MTRVLVVDDSKFFRTVVGNALTKAGFDVQTADDGLDAVDAAATFDPDVITMDVEMPDLNGIDAVERIMSTNPASIIMVSAYTDDGAEATLDALEAGAVDFVQKPDGSGSRNIAHFVDDIREKIDRLVEADVSSRALVRTTAAARATQSRARAGPQSRSRTQTRVSPRSGSGSGSTQTTQTSQSTAGVAPSVSRSQPESGSITPRSGTDADDSVSEAITADYNPAEPSTIVVGASTGGPKIVEQLCNRLPIELGARLLVVQHMPADFTTRFADRLDARSDYDVREARDGDRISSGEALVAPGGADLAVDDANRNSLRVRTVDDHPDSQSGIQPSIDVTMRTAAEQLGPSLCGVVLTGMGSDGAAGIEAIKTAGGQTIAQDEATSPVFGIPSQAIETGCVDAVVPAPAIVDEIISSVTGDSDD